MFIELQVISPIHKRQTVSVFLFLIVQLYAQDSMKGKKFTQIFDIRNY